MAKQHVRQFVRHHPGNLALGSSRLEHAAMDEHRPARERECVDLFQVHRRERVLVHGFFQLGGSSGDQSIAELGEIPRDSFVLDDRVLPLDLSGRFEADLHVLLRRVLVLRQLHRGLREERRPGRERSECQTAEQASDHLAHPQAVRTHSNRHAKQGAYHRGRALREMESGWD
jgi:hypothetical protein